MKYKELIRQITAAAFFLLIAIAGCAQDSEKPEAEAEAEATVDSTQINAQGLFDWKPFNEATELAQETDKKLLVYANATWCGYCKKMEREVFTSEEVKEITSEYFHPVWLDIDVTNDSLTFRGQQLSHRDFAALMRVSGTPTFLFFDEEGEIIAGQPGFLPEDFYKQILRFVGTGAYKNQSFSEFAEDEG